LPHAGAGVPITARQPRHRHSPPPLPRSFEFVREQLLPAPTPTHATDSAESIPLLLPSSVQRITRLTRATPFSLPEILPRLMSILPPDTSWRDLDARELGPEPSLRSPRREGAAAACRLSPPGIGRWARELALLHLRLPAARQSLFGSAPLLSL
jgi:hypothetical protein